MLSRILDIFVNLVVEITSKAIPRLFGNTYTDQSCRPFMSQNSINVDARSPDLFLPPVAIYGDAHIHMLTSVGDLFVHPMNKIQYMTAYQVQYMSHTFVYSTGTENTLSIHFQYKTIHFH